MVKLHLPLSTILEVKIHTFLTQYNMEYGDQRHAPASLPSSLI
jgi:hypothetical protein